jgi:hypothetical protein
LFSEEAYNALMLHRRNDVQKFQDMEGPLKGQVIVDKLSKDFELLSELKMVLQRLPSPSYDQYTWLDMEARKMVNFTYPTGK